MKFRSYWMLFVPLMTVVILIVCFKGGLHEYPFPFDDTQLFNQAYLRTPWSWQSFLSLITPGSSPDYYPIRDLSVWLDWSFTDNLMIDTSVPKIQNLIWLIGISILTYALLSEITRNKTVSLIASCAWLLHPFHFESLHWISARKDLMSWFFMLSAAYAFVLGVRRDHKSFHFYTLSILFFVASLLSKATFLAVPILTLSYLVLTRNSGIKGFLTIRPHKHVLTAVGISIAFAAVNFWNYSKNNNMQMSEEFMVRLMSVLAALGRNLVGVLFVKVNAVDPEPWGGWVRYNTQFIWWGVVGALAYITLFVVALVKRYSTVLIWLGLILSILVMTPGFNSLHRNYYSIRYFEPVFFLCFFGFVAFIERKKWGVKALLVIWGVFLSFHVWDVKNWTSNTMILTKAHATSPTDPSTGTSLLMEYYNALSLRPNDDVKEKYNLLFDDLVVACVTEAQLNGRCLSFYKHAKYFYLERGIPFSELKVPLKNITDKMSTLKRMIFGDVADAEIAWTQFHYEMDFNDRFDIQLLSTYFDEHKTFGDSYTRIVYVLYNCLTQGSNVSQERFQMLLNQKLIQFDDARRFVAELRSSQLKEKAKNCFAKQE